MVAVAGLLFGILKPKPKMAPKELFPKAGVEEVFHFWKGLFALDLSKSRIYDFKTRFVYATCPRESVSLKLKEIKKRLESKGNMVLFKNQTEEIDGSYILLAATHGQKQAFGRAVRRLQSYAFIADSLRKHKLHPHLKYITLPESYADSTLVSNAGAAGIWQFMRRTARLRGLKVTRKIDERLDAKRATSAFCRHMTYLLNKFGTYDLAITAYNKGDGAIKKLLKRRDGKTLQDILLWLDPESREYYARFLAAADVGKNYNRYGIDIDVEPIREINFRAASGIHGYDIIKIKDPIDFFYRKNIHQLASEKIYVLKDSNVVITLSQRNSSLDSLVKRLKSKVIDIHIQDTSKH